MTAADHIIYERNYAIRLIRTNRFPFFSLRSTLNSYVAAPPGSDGYTDPPIRIVHNPATHTALLEPPLATVRQSPDHNAVTHVTAFSEHVRRATARLPHFRPPFPPVPLAPL